MASNAAIVNGHYGTYRRLVHKDLNLSQPFFIIEILLKITIMVCMLFMGAFGFVFGLNDENDLDFDIDDSFAIVFISVLCIFTSLMAIFSFIETA